MKDNSKKHNKLPNDGFVNITWRCNSKCIMCNSWKREPGEELRPEGYAKLPKSLKFINISGGEPFLRDDLPDIIAVIDKHIGCEICISSNGLATDRIEKMMRDINRLKASVRLNISIDGIGDIHDKVRGVPGAFEKAINTLGILKNIGVKDTGIAYLTTNFNINQLEEVMKLAKKLKVDLTVDGTANNSDIHLASHNPPIRNLDELDRQYDDYVRHQLKTFSIRNWGRAFFNSGTPHYAATGKRNIPCSAGRDFFFLTPNGDMYPDMVLDYKLGNIEIESFEDIWFSKKAAGFRKTIEEKGYCETPCWMSCTVFPWMKRHKFKCVVWLAENKLRMHLGFSPKSIQKNNNKS